MNLHTWCASNQVGKASGKWVGRWTNVNFSWLEFHLNVVNNFDPLLNLPILVKCEVVFMFSLKLMS